MGNSQSAGYVIRRQGDEIPQEYINYNNHNPMTE